MAGGGRYRGGQQPAKVKRRRSRNAGDDGEAWRAIELLSPWKQWVPCLWDLLPGETGWGMRAIAIFRLARLKYRRF